MDKETFTEEEVVLLLGNIDPSHVEEKAAGNSEQKAEEKTSACEEAAQEGDAETSTYNDEDFDDYDFDYGVASAGDVANMKEAYYWAKGTGYGYNNPAGLSEWDVDKYLADKKKEESALTQKMALVAVVISRSAPAVSTLQSSLLPTIISYLRADSMLEISEHAELYEAILSVVASLAGTIPSLLTHAPHGTATVASLMELLAVQARSLIKTSKKAGADTDLALANAIVEAAQQCHSVAGPSTEAEHLPAVVSREDYYLACMEEMQLDETDMLLEDGTYDHYHKKNFTDSAPLAKMKRLATEVGSLGSSLPLSYYSSVFVRCDETRLDALKVMIMGPQDTPYENGCFRFDVFFPESYPSAPPKIQMRTTGNDSVRFNPNLYENGMVCLSLLGTWEGSENESWNADISTLLQAIVSIQSLILCPEPYFNEPGYETARGSKRGDAECCRYSSNIKKYTTLHAIIDQLRSPDRGFEDVIKVHFYLKREEVFSKVLAWKRDMDERGTSEITIDMVRELHTLLCALERPESIPDECVVPAVPCMEEATGVSSAEEPATPEAPVSAEEQATPQAPEALPVSEEQATPQAAQASEEPGTPEAPVSAEEQATPQAPEALPLSEEQATPQAAQASEEPATPEEPITPEAAEEPGTPEAAEEPGTPEEPITPRAADAPEAAEEAAEEPGTPEAAEATAAVVDEASDGRVEEGTPVQPERTEDEQEEEKKNGMPPPLVVIGEATLAPSDMLASPTA